MRCSTSGADPATPVADAAATFIWAIEDGRRVHRPTSTFPTAGAWGAEFTTTAAAARRETIRVRSTSRPTPVVAVGDPAPRRTRPTLADVGGDVAKISTDDDPVRAFYETSVADALAAKEPFVVVFATPKFCATAQCGPTLDRVKPVAAAPSRT